MGIRTTRIRSTITALALLVAGLALQPAPAGAYGGFEDVQSYEFYADAAAWMRAEGISGGTSPGCFSPDDTVTRAQAVAFLYRMAGSPGGGDQPFADLTAGWQLDPVAWAHRTGVTTGVAAHRFAPDLPVTRGDFATLLHRFNGGGGGGGVPFVDVTAPYQQDAVAWTYAAGVTGGVTPTQFAPGRTITRGEAAAMLWRYAGRPDVDPPADVPCRAGLPAGAFVTPDSVGNSVGPGAAAPAPTGVIGSRTINTPGTVLENVVVDGCLTVNADNVTIRNVVVNCGNTYPIKANYVDGLKVEFTRLDCRGNTSKGIYFEGSTNFRVDRIHITDCDDQFFIDGGLGYSTITNSVFHNQAPSSSAHTDGMQIGTFEYTDGTLVVEGNWWEYNRDGCCDNAVLFTSGQSHLTIEMRGNLLDADFGTYIVRCRTSVHCIIENNTVRGTPYGLFIHTHGETGGGVARCNRYTDGTLVPTRYIHGVVIDNSSC